MVLRKLSEIVERARVRKSRRLVVAAADDHMVLSAVIRAKAQNLIDPILVGDTEKDMVSAKANGFRSIAVDSGWTPREELLAAGADALFDDLSDQPRLLHAFGLA